MRWFQNIFGEWLCEDASVVARVCEQYVNDLDYDYDRFERMLERMIARHGRRAFG